MRLESLQELYQDAYEIVLITDHALNPLWQNRHTDLLSSDDLHLLFGGASSDEICNGPHFTRIGGDIYRFGVLRVAQSSDVDDFLFVLTFEDTDVIQSMLRCREVREYVENYTGTIRQSVTGVAMAANMLHELTAQEQTAAQQTEWLNIIMGHCYRLLKSTTSISDTVQNAEETDLCELIDYSSFLRTFTDVCGNLLGAGARLSCNTAAELYVSVPSARLLNCLLNILLAARGTHSGWDRFSLTAYAEDGFAVTEITASAAERMQGGSVQLTDTAPLYENGENTADEYLIRRFCERFGGRIRLRETDVFRCYTLSIPLADLNTGAVCCSRAEQYATDRFSRYHIALSAIMPHKFYQN
ncbi:MAG: hypothetical protein IJY85_06075 [Ruminococcus sp.]|nr:hypothetical protein [Ruminococcus sp.]